MVHTIESRNSIQGVDVAGGLMNLDKDLRLVLVGIRHEG